jgi:hypothetical protein
MKKLVIFILIFMMIWGLNAVVFATDNEFPWEEPAIEECEHVYVSYFNVMNPSCSEEGLELSTCTLCSEPDSRVLPMTEHTWGVWELITAPTCTEMGLETAECSECGITNFSEIVANGHTPGEWVTTLAATTEAEGVQSRSCTVCGETVDTRSIERLATVVTTTAATTTTTTAATTTTPESQPDETTPADTNPTTPRNTTTTPQNTPSQPDMIINEPESNNEDEDLVVGGISDNDSGGRTPINFNVIPIVVIILFLAGAIVTMPFVLRHYRRKRIYRY